MSKQLTVINEKESWGTGLLSDGRMFRFKTIVISAKAHKDGVSFKTTTLFDFEKASKRTRSNGDL